ncbi:MAG: twin-arginine translocase TatA/TatE family subunit [Rhodospirillales bacterium]|nr:twin-arginine translocase TatA/TatE family subunit [Rhodospirillales bacterium]
MGALSIWHWLIVLVIVLLLFGRGRIPKLAGDLARGIREFKSGIKEEETAKTGTVEEAPQTIEAKAGEAESSTTKEQTVKRT